MDDAKFLEDWGEEIMSAAHEQGIDGPLDRAHALLTAHRDSIGIDVVRRAVRLFNGTHELDPKGHEVGVFVRGIRWVVRCTVHGLICMTPKEHQEYLARVRVPRPTSATRAVVARLTEKIYPIGHPLRSKGTPPEKPPVVLQPPAPEPHVHGPACHHGRDEKADVPPVSPLPDATSAAKKDVRWWEVWKKRWWTGSKDQDV